MIKILCDRCEGEGVTKVTMYLDKEPVYKTLDFCRTCLIAWKESTQRFLADE